MEARKVRSDKKHPVNPTISINTKDAIYRLAAVTGKPVKELGETICEYGLQSLVVMDGFSNSFRRPYQLKSTLYLGTLERQSLQKRSQTGQNERISIRFAPETYEELKKFAYALDVTPSRAAALLLESSLNNSNFMNEYFRDYLKDQLADYKKMEQLTKAIRTMNQNSSYDQEISWGVLLSVLTDEMNAANMTLSEIVTDFIDHWN